jgi:hypothetical protein
MLPYGVVLVHDSARAHTSAFTRALLEHFNLELFDYPDCHLFSYLWNNNNEGSVEDVKTWLSSQAADFFDTGIQNLIPRCDKCINSGGYYAEK